MRRQRPQPLSPLLGLLALGWGLACIGIMLGSEGKSVGLSALSAPEVVLMSCAADASADYSLLSSALGNEPSGHTPEPLWCENPESPQCQPGSPDSNQQHYSVGPLATRGDTLPASNSTWLLPLINSWSRAGTSLPIATAARQRLERPPRIG